MRMTNQVSENRRAGKARLEEIRAELRGERISMGELCELQELIPFMESDDVELLEPAGVPEEIANKEPLHITSSQVLGIGDKIRFIDTVSPLTFQDATVTGRDGNDRVLAEYPFHRGIMSYDNSIHITRILSPDDLEMQSEVEEDVFEMYLQLYNKYVRNRAEFQDPNEPQSYTINLTARADMTARVVVMATNEAEAVRGAIDQAEAGDVVWEYDGIVDGTIETN